MQITSSTPEQNKRPGHDIIVVGASPGGVEAISQRVRGLPADLPVRVIGVLLSGTLDRGTAGLIAIKNQGGVAIT